MRRSGGSGGDDLIFDSLFCVAVANDIADFGQIMDVARVVRT
jgi:hypothetical protein